DVRVLERLPAPRPWAPALAIHARTMEALRGLGVADDLISRGLTKVDLEVHVGDSVVSGTLGDLELPTTEYPFVFFAPQIEVEASLRERLASLGVNVEWASTFRSFRTIDDEVVCRFDVRGQESLIHARYLAGCDGADSVVRRESGTAFRGRSYRESVVIADIDAAVALKDSTAHAFIGTNGILFLFPLPSGRWRLIGPGSGTATPETVTTMVETHARREIDVSAVDRFEVVRLQHRLADRYRRGRVFLAGDAAHVHSPAGAQGMNTGIQDAVNLGWKLALVLKGAPESLLDTYDRERRRVAKQVVLWTGLAFALEVSKLAPFRWGRRWMALPAARLLLTRRRLVSVFGRVASGLDTSYREGALEVAGRLGRCRPGRRLPDHLIRAGETSRVHHLITADRFHLLTFDEAVDVTRVRDLADAYGDLLRWHHVGSIEHEFAVSWALVRPDGYIAAANRGADLEAAERYLLKWLGTPGVFGHVGIAEKSHASDRGSGRRP
ncbi:MAG TPA: FAD-dependent monooxygenase, partial [Acidimicrobiia bacterium]